MVPPPPPTSPFAIPVRPTPSGVPDPIVRPAGPNDVFRAGAWTYTPPFDPRFGGARSDVWFPGSYAAGGYLPYYPAVPAEAPAPRQGRLNLHVTPGDAHVLVDGFYVGTVSDFQDRGLWIESGPRRIDLRADGYDAATFDVRIVGDQTVDYRKDLTRQAASVVPPPRAATPKTFYVIPGCYAGDKPPRAGRLPPGCRAANVREIPPVLELATRR